MSKLFSRNYYKIVLRKPKIIQRFTSTETCGTLTPLFDLKCKTAIITGGASGIGFAIAHQFLLDKAKSVALIGLDNCAGREAVNSLNSCHGKNKSIFIKCDVNNKSKLKEAFQKILEEFREVHVVVNSIGLFDGKHWELELTTNLSGTINSTLSAHDFMCKTKGGNGGIIINLSGTHGLIPFASAPTLSAGFHGIIGFSRSFGAPMNYSRTGIRLVTLCPGITHTDFIKEAQCKGLYESLGDNLLIELSEATKQKSDPCGEAAIHLMKYGQTGSVWVVEGSKLYSLKIPDWKCYSALAAQYI